MELTFSFTMAFFLPTYFQQEVERCEELKKICRILFPIEDLRQAVESAKRILTKEKLDKHLTGQTSTSPFMSIREGVSRRVSFGTKRRVRRQIRQVNSYDR